LARKIFHEGFLMGVFKQAGRLGKLHTVLGEDVLVLLRFTGTDKLNDLFDFTIEALSDNPSIDFNKLIGTHATVELGDGDNRKFHDGVVTQAQWMGPGENGIRYNLTLKPWLWLAGRKRNQRIFHNKNVSEILQELLAPYQSGGARYANKCAEAYPALEYTVQYRESDLEFACRMMERFGISYHFRHAKGNHTLVLTDSIDQHNSIGARPYHGSKDHHMAAEEHFWEWQPARNLTTGAIRPMAISKVLIIRVIFWNRPRAKVLPRAAPRPNAVAMRGRGPWAILSAFPPAGRSRWGAMMCRGPRGRRLCA
jgi:type VI secretion system secreted protein VgrG